LDMIWYGIDRLLYFDMIIGLNIFDGLSDNHAIFIWLLLIIKLLDLISGLIFIVDCL